MNEIFDPSTWARQLSPHAVALGAHLSACPAQGLALQSVAALTGLPTSETVRHLVALGAAGLVREDASLYSAISTTSPQRSDQAAVRRLALWFLHACNSALASMGMNTAYWRPQSSEPVELPGFAEFADAYRWMRGQRATMLALLRAAVQIGPEPYIWQLAWAVTIGCAQSNDTAAWLEAVDLGQQAATGCGDDVGLGVMLEARGKAHSQRGRTATAMTYQQQSSHVRTAAGDQPGLVRVHNYAGLISWRQGHYADAIGHFRAATALATEINDEQFVMISRANAAGASVESGVAIEDGVEQALTEAVEYFRNHGGPLYSVAYQQDLARLRRNRNSLQPSLRTARQALREALALGIEMYFGPAMIEVALTRARMGQRADAVALLREAAGIYLHLDDTQRYAEALNLASGVLREMGGRENEAAGLAQHACDELARLAAEDEPDPQEHLTAAR